MVECPQNGWSKKNRFKSHLFKGKRNQQILKKVKIVFGSELKDYGKTAYNFLYQKEKTERIDIFNGNYSLFRGLAVSFLIIAVLCFIYLNNTVTLFAFILFILSTSRMIRFAKHYAKELFRTLMNYED